MCVSVCVCEATQPTIGPSGAKKRGHSSATGVRQWTRCSLHGTHAIAAEFGYGSGPLGDSFRMLLLIDRVRATVASSAENRTKWPNIAKRETRATGPFVSCPCCCCRCCCCDPCSGSFSVQCRLSHTISAERIAFFFFMCHARLHLFRGELSSRVQHHIVRGTHGPRSFRRDRDHMQPRSTATFDRTANQKRTPNGNANPKGMRRTNGSD